MGLAHLDDAIGVSGIHHANVTFGRLYFELLCEPFISALTGVPSFWGSFPDIFDQCIKMGVRV